MIKKIFFYERRIQYLPVLGKCTYLFVNTYAYKCDNPVGMLTLSNKIILVSVNLPQMNMWSFAARITTIL